MDSLDRAQLRSIAEWALLQNRDPDDEADALYKYLYNLRSDLPPYKKAQEWTIKIDNFISSFDYLLSTKANIVAAILSLLHEIKALGKLNETPYWRIVKS